MKKQIYWLMLVLMVCITFMLGLSCQAETSNPATSPVNTISPTSPAATSTHLVPVNTQYPATPIYNPDPGSFVPESDIVVIGQVLESSDQIKIDNNTVRDWQVKIESWLVNQLPQDTITVRIWEQSSGIIPVKGVHLSQGEHALMFLKSSGEYFIFTGGMMGVKYSINGDQIRYSIIANSPLQSLSEAISNIKAVGDTWANEKLTDERRNQITKIAVNDPGINDFLRGKKYEIDEITPYVSKETLHQICYIISIYIPQQNTYDVQLAVNVNVNKNGVDDIQVNPGYTEYSDTAKNQIQQIALADPTVQWLIGDRGYKVINFTRDSWQETVDGRTVINIFPKIEISLQPATSNIIKVFVDLEAQKAVKIFNESYLSTAVLTSSVSWQDFTLTIELPKTNFKIGEIAKAQLTLSYNGVQPVELSSPNGQYFDLIIRDQDNNIIYQWERNNAGLSPSLPVSTTAATTPAPLTAIPENPVKATLNPGQTITQRLEFSLPKAGIFYLQGRNYGGWDFGQILVSYPNGTGYGLNMNAPFILIEGH